MIVLYTHLFHLCYHKFDLQVYIDYGCALEIYIYFIFILFLLHLLYNTFTVIQLTVLQAQVISDEPI